MRSSLRIRLALACSLIGCAVAQARIGETEKQCEERYGKPNASTDGDKSKSLYKKEDMIVLAHFYEGKCDYIAFFKLDGATSKIVEMSENEKKLLMRANGGSREWRTSERATAYQFETGDGELFARYIAGERCLAVFTFASLKRQDEEISAKEEKKLKGF
jgi:hypothetical protein